MSDERRFLSDQNKPVGDDQAHKETTSSGMQKDYVVLSSEERARGFVRPVRTSYWHVGRPGPKHPTRDLTEEEKVQYAGLEYVKFEPYPEGENIVGRFWTQAMLDRINAGCNAQTTMNIALAETYARDPKFYGGTFCAACRKHYPVGEDGEFIWDDGSRVGS